jgi:hypothetical protein
MKRLAYIMWGYHDEEIDAVYAIMQKGELVSRPSTWDLEARLVQVYASFLSIVGI